MIGHNLKHLRTRRKISQQRVANYLKIPRSTYSSWEQNISEPSITMLRTLSNFFLVTIDELTKPTKKPSNIQNV